MTINYRRPRRVPFVHPRVSFASLGLGTTGERADRRKRIAVHACTASGISCEATSMVSREDDDRRRRDDGRRVSAVRVRDDSRAHYHATTRPRGKFRTTTRSLLLAWQRGIKSIDCR